MINYLFCLDENYNNQFLTTLKSINDNSKIKFNVYVIHEKPEKLEVNFEKYKDKFSDNKAGADAGSTDMEGAAPLPPGPELAHVVKYGDILRESIKIADSLILESSKTKKKVLKNKK